MKLPGVIVAAVLGTCSACQAVDTAGSVGANVVTAAPLPGIEPGAATAACQAERAVLGNQALQATWSLEGSRLLLTAFKDQVNQSTSTPQMPVFTLQLGDGTVLSAAALKPATPFKLLDLAPQPSASVLAERSAGKCVEVHYDLPAQKLGLTWRAILRDGSNYIRQELVLDPHAEGLVIGKLTLLSLPLPGAHVSGAVQGSPVTTNTLFLGIEHPSAAARVSTTSMQWSPTDFPRGNKPVLLKYDLGETLTTAGEYEFTFQYTSGHHRLDVEQVRILADGQEVAATVHHGFAGLPSRDNVYTLKVPAFSKATRYTLEVKAYTDQGANSYGDIRVKRDGQATGGGTPRCVCVFSRAAALPAGRPWAISSVMGVAPPGQMRRAFGYYLERERAHPYRPFLHYNSWYHLNIDRPDCRMTDAEAVKAVNDIGAELTTKRGLKLASYVMDDGWDSRHKVWDFHDGFPQGFNNVAAAAEKYGSGIGLWMSPWGGYGGRDQRIAAGRPFGYETNGNGFSMAGKNYRTHFQNTALRMIHDYHANFFKFDGMGGGAMTDGGDSAYANDMDAIIGVCRELRQAKPDVFISATVGTWPSPFWLRYVDSIWRQGEDTQLAGVGNGRERWITYRDATVYERIVQRGPLYPLQSLMMHGIVIGTRGLPARMDRTEDSVRHEARSFFGSGTDLQELYLTPELLTPGMWDAIAQSAAWAQRRADCLVDSHWIGGDPRALAIYGFASWVPGKGTLTLRNPSDKPQTLALDIAAAFDLPKAADQGWQLTAPYKDQSLQLLKVAAGQPRDVTLAPFDVLVFDASPLAAGS